MSARTDLFNLIGELARRRYQEGEKAFASLGLNHTEARLLSLLSQMDGRVRQDALSAKVHVDRSNVGRALKGLELKLLVSRCRDSESGKTNQVALTAKGTEAAARVADLREEVAQRFFSALSEPEALEAIDLLKPAVPGHGEGEPGL